MKLVETKYEEAIDTLGRQAWEEVVQLIEERAIDLIEEGEVTEDTEDWELREIAENTWEMYVGPDVEVRLEELEVDEDEFEIVYEVASTYCVDVIRHLARQNG